MTEEKELKIFSYGILRKRSMLKSFIEEHDLSRAEVNPDVIEGFVPYHSGRINMVYEVRQRQKDKYPDGDFIVKGSTISFFGEKENLEKLEAEIDRIESAYNKTIMETKNDTDVIVYTMEQEYKQLFNLYGIGLIIYPDSITHKETVFNKEKYPNLKESGCEGINELFGCH